MAKKGEAEVTPEEQEALDESLVPEELQHDGVHGPSEPPSDDAEDEPFPEYTFNLNVDTTYTTTVDGEELDIVSGPDGVYVTVDPKEIYALKNVFGFAPQ